MSFAVIEHAHADAVKSCIEEGWKPLNVQVAGQNREILWKRPLGKWKQGAIVVLHGDGGGHHDFCAGDDQQGPPIEFAEDAVAEGFAVFLLESTEDVVTDAKGQNCGKGFDFSVLDRPNVDLQFISKVVKTIIPQLSSSRSTKKIFLTGVSTGGYMAIRAAVRFNNRITAFAPVSAGDPYGTSMNCHATDSKRKIIVGSLIDMETNKPTRKKNACLSENYSHEKDWPRITSKHKVTFKQFHDRGDGVVDISCMKKIKKQLQQHGYESKG
ncbi:MAG: hypothetical protein KAT25_02340 [Sulfuriflexus sp.]|nr:hypothetical protein [Sulfuriflexus sp.]